MITTKLNKEQRQAKWILLSIMIVFTFLLTAIMLMAPTASPKSPPTETAPDYQITKSPTVDTVVQSEPKAAADPTAAQSTRNDDWVAKNWLGNQFPTLHYEDGSVANFDSYTGLVVFKSEGCTDCENAYEEIAKAQMMTDFQVEFVACGRKDQTRLVKDDLDKYEITSVPRLLYIRDGILVDYDSREEYMSYEIAESAKKLQKETGPNI